MPTGTIPQREAFIRLLEHLSTHLAPDDDCPRCELLRAIYEQDYAERVARRAAVQP